MLTHAASTRELKLPLAFTIEHLCDMPATTSLGWHVTVAVVTSWHEVLAGVLHWNGAQAVHAWSSALDAAASLRNLPAAQNLQVAKRCFDWSWYPFTPHGLHVRAAVVESAEANCPALHVV